MEKRIHNILSDIFEIDENDINDQLTPRDIALWDSMNHLLLITAIEDELGIKFSMEEIQSIDSIHRLKELVKQNMSGK